MDLNIIGGVHMKTYYLMQQNILRNPLQKTRGRNMSRIYVSSTFKDLEEYRKSVRFVLNQMKHEGIAMEYYVAENQPPLEKCLADVASCDLYIGIFAWKYGSIPIGKDKSFTELEYEKAVETGKDCLIFLLHEEAPWPKTLMDKGDDELKIENLRNKLSKKHTVSFFKSPQELASLVGVAVHNYLENVRGIAPLKKEITADLNIEKYRNSILKRYKILDLDALTPSERADYMEFHLRSVFVEQDVRENPPPVELPKELMEKLIKDEKLKKEDLPEGITFEDIKKAKEAYLEKPALPVLDVIINSENRYVVILGDPGSGKSTLSRYLVLSLLTKEDEKLQKAFDNYLPLLIELRDCAAECAKNKCSTFIEYLDLQGETKGYGLTKEAIDNYLNNDGKAIVIFDGLDEIFDPSQRENIEQQIIGFTTDHPKTRVITTSRIVGYKRRNLTNADFSHYTLQDFRKPQIDTFIDKWYSIALINNPDEAHARKERIDRAIEESASIRQLAGNPLLLTIMAIINKHQELPRERWGLYEHASSVLIYHWDWERKIKEWNIKIEYVSKGDKEELLRRLAYKMQSAPKGLAGNYIHADALQAEFEKYFIERYQRNPADAKLAAQALIEQLRERNFILCRYGANLYGFIHRTFLEYFCAWSIVWKFNVKHELYIENLKDIFNEHWNDESWHEVLRLICGMIDEKFSDTLIYNLMEAPAPNQFDIVRAKVNNFSEVTDLADIRFWYTQEMNDEKLFEPLIYELTQTSPPDQLEIINAELIKFSKKHDWYTKEGRNRIIKSFEDMGIYVNFWKAKRIDLAIKCMGELKNIELIRPTSSKLLNETCELIEFGIQGSPDRIFDGLFRFVNKNLILSAISIGKRWAGREQIIEWIPKFVNRLQNVKKMWSYYGIEENVGKFIGSIGSGDNNIKHSVESLLNNDFAGLALIALVSGWHDDPNTLPLIKNIAISNEDSNIRSKAIRALLEGWPDHPNIFFFHVLKDINDPDNYIRNTAVEALLEDWHDHPDTLNLIKYTAINDVHFAIRHVAIKALAKGWHDHPDALSLVKDRAIGDNNYTVRSTAIMLLTEGWHDDPDTLHLLKDRAMNDESETIREEAARLLEDEYFLGNAPKTFIDLHSG